jgi:alpha-beta hydrolase superfamily lysophospholipase
VQLERWGPSGECRGLVLLLHGGKPRSTQAVDGRSLSWQRIRALGREISPRLHEAGLAVWVHRFTERGWNGGGADRIADAREALTEAKALEVPVVVLGHSMGARTAVQVADDPHVVGVVALAPWFDPRDSVGALAGKRLIAAHGTHDRITSARATQAYLRRASAVAEVEYVDMGPLGHYLLRGRRRWNEVALRSCLDLFA